MYYIFEIFQQNIPLHYIFPFGLGGMLFVTVITCLCKSKESFFACACLMGGGIYLSCFLTNVSKDGIAFCVACLLSWFGICYIGLLSAFAIRRKKEFWKKQREQILRKLQYTLPERDNSYVRERLHTTLRPQEKNRKTIEGNAENGNEIMNLEHVRKLLTKIKNAPLSQAERLETEEMSRMFALYLKKDKWTPSDVRTVNELFSALLKVAAKYSV